MLINIPKSKLNRALTALAAVFLLCIMQGCSMMGGQSEDLFKLPKLAGFVSQLQTEIDAIMAQGGEYAAPTQGVYRQSVQLEDLDGDGRDEAIMFLRMPDSVMRVCLLKQDKEGGFYKFAEADKEGSAFETVSYVDLNGDGSREILVGRSVGLGLPKALSVLSLDGEEGFRELLSVTYSGFTTIDLGGDGGVELVLVRHDAITMSGIAEVYRYSEGDRALLLDDSEQLSGGLVSLKRLRTGKLVGGESAVFLSGETDKGGIATDILAIRGGTLTNITLNESTGQSREIVSNYTIWGSDLNGDGVFDLPMPVILDDYAGKVSGDTFRKIIWRNYNIKGAVVEVFVTIHNSNDGWYFILPEAWSDVVSIDRRDNIGGTSGEKTIVISALISTGGEREAVDLMAIYTLTGDNRVDRSELPNRFVISTAQTRSITGTIYAAWLFELPAELRYLSITEEQVTTSFKLIQTEWLTGELTN